METRLLAIDGSTQYALDLEVCAAPSAALDEEITEARYQEWVEKFVPDWQRREVVIVAGSQWRDLAGGHELFDALELARCPQVSYQRVPGGLCARSGSSSQCMGIGVLRNGAQPRLIDVRSDQVDAAIYVGPRVASSPTAAAIGWRESLVNASIVLFLDGYLTS